MRACEPGHLDFRPSPIDGEVTVDQHDPMRPLWSRLSVTAAICSTQPVPCFTPATPSSHHWCSAAVSTATGDDRQRVWDRQAAAPLSWPTSQLTAAPEPLLFRHLGDAGKRAANGGPPASPKS